MRYEDKLTAAAVADLGRINDGEFAKKYGGTRVTVCNARQRLGIASIKVRQESERQPRTGQLTMWLHEGQKERWKIAARKDKKTLSKWMADLAEARVNEQA